MSDLGSDLPPARQEPAWSSGAVFKTQILTAVHIGHYTSNSAIAAHIAATNGFVVHDGLLKNGISSPRMSGFCAGFCFLGFTISGEIGRISTAGRICLLPSRGRHKVW